MRRSRRAQKDWRGAPFRGGARRHQSANMKRPVGKLESVADRRQLLYGLGYMEAEEKRKYSLDQAAVGCSSSV